MIKIVLNLNLIKQHFSLHIFQFLQNIWLFIYFFIMYLYYYGNQNFRGVAPTIKTFINKIGVRDMWPIHNTLRMIYLNIFNIKNVHYPLTSTIIGNFRKISPIHKNLCKCLRTLPDTCIDLFANAYLWSSATSWPVPQDDFRFVSK